MVACIVHANQLPASSHSGGYRTDIVIIVILATIEIMEGMLSKMPTVSKMHGQYGKGQKSDHNYPAQSVGCDHFATPTSLNKVGEKSNITTVPEASGSDFPHIVMLDFAQDMKLGREEVGRSRPTATPIQHDWSMGLSRACKEGWIGHVHNW